MSKLDELLAELCPDGVEYRELKDVLTIKNGKDYKGLSEGNYPVYGSGGIMAYVSDYVYDKPSVLIPRKGSIDKLYYVEEPFWNVDTIFYTDIDITKAVPRYIYFCLQKEHLEQYNTAGGVPSLTQKVLNKVKLPIPPLEVQREIVRMLDSFTLLTAELTAELAARKKQYEFYRGKLLSFTTNVTVCEIGKVCSLSAGGDVPKEAMSEVQTDEYPIPIISNGIGEKGFYGYTNSYKVNKPCVTVAARGAGVGYVTYRDYPFFPIIRLVSVVPGEKLNPKFLYYAMQRIKFEPTQGGIPQLTVPMISKYKIPVPKMDVQNRIVNVLDHFESICSDLNIGLPAEIKARQKQYEYYRDLLLTFAETGSTLVTDGQTELNVIRLIQYVFGYAVLPLRKVANVFRGEYITKKSTTKGDIPVILGGQEPAYYINKYNHDGEIVVIARSGVSAGFVSYWNRKIYVTDGFGYEGRSELVTTKYLYYVLKNMETALNAMKRGAGVPHVSGEALSNVMLHIPALQEQQRVVNILDRFDTLCNDLSEGLPAEIEARRKQYEYYRDKLLSFEELQKK